MTRLAILLLMCSPAWAKLSIADYAGIASITASSGTIIKQGHDLITKPGKTVKGYGKGLANAVKGKPAPPPPTPFHEGKN
jgi:hypothetical protein